MNPYPIPYTLGFLFTYSLFTACIVREPVVYPLYRGNPRVISLVCACGWSLLLPLGVLVLVLTGHRLRGVCL